jgi:hypothetical protein
MRTLVAVFIATALVSACTPADENDVLRPLTDDKTDLNLAAITERGTLAFSDEAAGEFDADFEFFGYRFGARAGAQVTVEITQRGTARDLDTTLFVYGPQVTGYSDEIAFDDDSGWGAQSRLEELELPADGVYLIVVGTADGRGRGQFNLALGCDSDSCLMAEEAFSCDEFQDIVTDCVHEFVDEYLAESDWGYEDCPNGHCPVDEDTIDEGWHFCTGDAEVVRDNRYIVCDDYGTVRPVPSWCTEPVEAFFAETWADCPSSLTKPPPSDFEWEDWP